MGNSQSSSPTEFVSDGGIPVGHSVKPCHIFGDPDLYGLGIRIGFYLQYGGAFLAVVCKSTNDFRIWRASFVSIAIATFISLCINSTGDSLVIIDWAIMLQLVIWFPFFLAYPVFRGIRLEKRVNDQIQTNAQLAGVLHDTFKRTTEEFGVRLSRYYAEAYKATLLLVYDYGPGVAIDALNAYNEYMSSFNEPGADPAAITARGELHRRLEGAVREIRELPHDREVARRALATLRAGHLQRLDNLVVPGDVAGRAGHLQRLDNLVVLGGVAKRAEAKVEEVAEQELKVHSRWRFLRDMPDTLRSLGLLDKVTAGLSLLVYSAYCFLTPWLYFFSIGNGAKPGCDVWLLVSVYDPSFDAFLKAMGCLSVVVGLIALVYGTTFLVAGLVQGLLPEQQTAPANLEAADQQPLLPAQEQQQQLIFPGATNTGPGPSNDPTAGLDAIVSTLFPGNQHALFRRVDPHHYAAQHIQFLQDTQARNIRNVPAPDPRQMRREVRKYPVWWPWFLLILLTETVVMVELTISKNHLDMGRQPFMGTGELIAFFVGVFTFFIIGYNAGSESFRDSRRPLVRTIQTWLIMVAEKLDRFLDILYFQRRRQEPVIEVDPAASPATDPAGGPEIDPQHVGPELGQETR